MQTPVHIQFQNMKPSEAVEAAVKKRAEKLERLYPSVQRCRVVVSAPSPKKQHGGIFHTRIDLRLPGQEIVVNRSSDQHHAHTDVYVSIRDAFDKAQRQLEETIKALQGKVKSKAAPVPGDEVEQG